jgi:hypothetical protein
MRKRSSVNVFAFMMVMVAGLAFLPAVPAHAMCPDNVVGYWKLDETTGPYTDFIRGNNGTGSPLAPTAADGTVDGAQEFGVADADTGIDVAATSAFNWTGTDSFTIELWVKTDGVAPTGGVPAGNEVLIGRKEDATNMQWWIGIQGGTGNLTFALRDVGGANQINQTVVGDSLTDDTEWHHVVLVRDASSETNTLYLDGQVQDAPVTQAFDAGFGSVNSKMTIGYLAGTTPAFYFDGLIDEVALYDRALGSIEIGEHYTTGLGGDDLCGGVDSPGAPYPLASLSLWPLNAAAGPTYVDMVGGKNGTGSPAAPTAADGIVIVNGTVDGAQEFGVADADTGIDVAATSAFNWTGTDSFTIELWVKTDGVAPTGGVPAGNEVLIGRKEDATNMQWWIGIQGGTGNLTFALRDVGGANQINQTVVGDSLTDDTEWHHVVLVRDASSETNTLYLDGQVQDAPVTQAFDAGFGSVNSKMTIGYLAGTTPAFYFDGLIDEVAIYGRALDLTEIGEHYDNGFLDNNSVTALRPEPAADAGADQSVTEGDTVELDGSGSSDADGTIVSYQWQQLTGPTATPLANAATDTASFTAPTVDAAGAILTFRLTVTDNEGQSSSNDTSVQVNDTTTTTPTPPPTGGGGGGGGCFISTLF